MSTSLRGAGFVEYLTAMRACWGPDPVEHRGDRYQIPTATVGPKPWGESIPLFLGAVTQPTVERAARIADGFTTVVFDWRVSREQIRWYRDAGGAGRVVGRWLPDGIDQCGTASAFAEVARPQFDHAVAAGVNELHVELNLTDMEPRRQLDLLAAATDGITH